MECLSGGQRQRVWIAMVPAQETPCLLLDEPTTFLDLAHQYRLLSLPARLRDGGRTVVAVLHDLSQACRYADHLVAMREGRVVAEGAPADIVDARLIREVFGLPCVVVPDPVTGAPMVLPAPGTRPWAARAIRPPPRAGRVRRLAHTVREWPISVASRGRRPPSGPPGCACSRPWPRTAATPMCC
ncbi:ABC transporter ATP-binding protein [Streptomyces boetiae]|uniref:ABC transporter ATP-binding protein n=1 Tax=Streptomyces boetiae TaxID=3075541 RepID=UPI00374E0D64